MSAICSSKSVQEKNAWRISAIKDWFKDQLWGAESSHCCPLTSRSTNTPETALTLKALFKLFKPSQICFWCASTCDFCCHCSLSCLCFDVWLKFLFWHVTWPVFIFTCKATAYSWKVLWIKSVLIISIIKVCWEMISQIWPGWVFFF